MSASEETEMRRKDFPVDKLKFLMKTNMKLTINVKRKIRKAQPRFSLSSRKYEQKAICVMPVIVFDKYLQLLSFDINLNVYLGIIDNKLKTGFFWHFYI